MDNILLVAAALFGGAWDMLTGVNFPATELSFAEILVGSVLVIFGLKIIRVIFAHSYINTDK